MCDKLAAYEEAQAQFARAITQSNATCEALTTASRVNIRFYQLNHRYNRIDALALAFPTILALLGDDFFRAMALNYVESTPAQSANLSEDGATFADYIAQFPPAAPYPYLSDCARLDWALHRAHFAPNMTVLSAQEVASNFGAESQMGAIRLSFHPSLQLVTSNWSIQSIWQMHHGEETPADWGQAETVLVWRRAQLGEATRLIRAEDVNPLIAILAGQTLAEALETASDDFDLSGYLQFWLQEQLITGISF